MRLARLAAALLVASVPAMATASAPAPPVAKRVAPPEVKPLRMGALTIRVIHWAHDHGLGSNGGVIEAVDAATGVRRWRLRVYADVRDPALEGDVQDVFITRLTRAGAGRIRVEDERQRRWLVDLASRRVTPLR